MKTLRIAQASILVVSLASAAALGGCAPKAMAPRIPSFKTGPGAPFGDETVLPEPAPSMLREAPDEIAPPPLVK